MKHLILPLLTASLILATLTPRANAAAIASDPGLLSPRRLGRSALTRHVAGVERVRPIKAPRLLGSSREIVPAISGSSVFGGTLDLGIGGVIKTGAGTLSLNGSSFAPDAGNVQISGGLVTTNTWAGVGSGGSAGVTLNGGNLSIATGVLSVNSGSLLSSGLVITGSGSVSIDVENGNFSGSGDINLVVNGGGNIAPPDFSSGGAATEAAPVSGPVPEPGSAILFAIGALAASQARRRRAV